MEPEVIVARRRTSQGRDFDTTRSGSIATIATFAECYIRTQNLAHTASSLVACSTETDAQHA
eukprot:11662349-Prorocentrum_lima.AAC.1